MRTLPNFALVDGVLNTTGPGGDAPVLGRFAIINKTYVDSFTAYQDGVTTSAQAAINAGLLANIWASGSTVRLRSGSLCAIANLNLASGHALVCDEGGIRPTLYMPPSVFTNTDPSFGARYGPTAVGLMISGQLSGAFTPITDVTLENFILQGQSTDGRCLQPITVRNANRIKIHGVNFANFGSGRAIAATGVRDFEVDRCWFHDFVDNYTSWAAQVYAQITCIEFDNDVYNGRTSSDVRLTNLRYNNILQGPASLAAYGQQSDFLTIVNNATTGIRLNGLTGNGVGEVIDSFGNLNSYSDIDVSGTIGFIIKFGHGAQNERANGITADDAAVGAVTFYNQPGDAQATSGCSVTDLTCTSINKAGSYAGTAAGVFIEEGTGSTYHPTNNTVRGANIGGGAHCVQNWRDETAGSGNIGEDILITSPGVGSGSGTPTRIDIQHSGGAVRLRGTTSYVTTLA